MDQAMDLQRTHRKSRTGCVTCKARKIKCDEARPVCRNCQRKFPEKICCIYDAKPIKPRTKRSSSQPPKSFDTTSQKNGEFDSPSPTASVPRNFSEQSSDLQLWHHYLTETSITLPPPQRPQVQALWWEDVPKWAYQHDFLLDALFGMTSIHIYTQTQDKQFLGRAYRYYAEAASKYSKALSRASSETSGAILATSLFIGFQTKIIPRLHAANEPYKLPIATFHLQRGVPTTYKAVAALLPDPHHRITALFVPETGLENAPACHDPSNLSQPVANDAQEILCLLDNSETMSETSKMACRTAFALVLEIHRAYNKQQPQMMLHCRRSIPAFFWTAPWQYVELLEQQDPLALLILARYFAISKAGDDLWWTQGLAEREVAGIAGLLAPEWSRLMDFPFSLLAQMTDARLASQSPADSSYASPDTSVMKSEGRSSV